MPIKNEIRLLLSDPWKESSDGMYVHYIVLFSDVKVLAVFI